MSPGRASFDAVEVEYQEHGTGEPVVFIHPGHFADWFEPLVPQPELSSNYRLVRYNRVGCRGSTRISGPVSLADQSDHCQGLMRHLRIDRAHLVGRSSGANVALQVALDAPDMVQSLALLEPALMTVPSAPTSRAPVGQAIQLYQSGDPVGAIDTFLRYVCGSDYRGTLDRVLPGSFDQYVEDAGTFFAQELPALQGWSFTQDDARRIQQPVLAVTGEKSAESDQIWRERHELLLSWLPNVEPFVLPGTNHLLQLANPKGMAEGLAAFFARHPMQVAA